MTTVYLVINIIIFYISGSSGEKLRKCLFCFKQQTEHPRFTGSAVTTEYRVSLLFFTDLSRVPESVTQAITSWLPLPLFPVLETSGYFLPRPLCTSIILPQGFHSVKRQAYSKELADSSRPLEPVFPPCSVSPLAYYYFPFRSPSQHLLLRATTLLLYLLLTDVQRG